jgi:hypothetical protein
MTTLDAELDIIFGDGVQHGQDWAGMLLVKDNPDPQRWTWTYVVEHRTQSMTEVLSYPCVHDLVKAADTLHPLEQWTKA